MAYTHTHQETVSSDGLRLATASKQVTADGKAGYSGTIATGQTAFEVDIAIDVSAVKSLVISSDKALTMKTNSTGSPDQTIAIAANTPIIWKTGDIAACPLTVDVTKLYFANASGALATVVIEALIDITP